MNKIDSVLNAFLDSQLRDAQALNEASDLVEVIPQRSSSCQLYAVRFFCTGLIKDRVSGTIKEHSEFDLAVYFSDRHLSRCEPTTVVRWVAPDTVWHPNVNPPFICLGRIFPGMRLVEIVGQAFEIINYQKVTMIEADSLNSQACSWARKNTARFPVDHRQLRRSTIEFTLEELGKEVKK